MIKITPTALKELTGFLTEKKATPSVRVILPPASCGGLGQLSLTVDAPGETDFSTKEGGLTLVINKGLLEKTGGVTIDFQNNGFDSGFVVESEKLLPPATPDCSGCDGCFN
ncbi:MAG: IscA/HesB family protein [Deltaproteobacteria bacterium]|jgi:Fe-S cluster assembly iron-binding protein IscA|nr:IscA/HesB family protein [Deltaproteobacteria bacterium]